MDLNEYQRGAARTEKYRQNCPNVIDRITYTALGVAGEAGEVANQAKKIIRDDERVATPERREAMLDEFGDTLWYVAMGSLELGVSLQDVADRNLAKLRLRHGVERPREIDGDMFPSEASRIVDEQCTCAERGIDLHLARPDCPIHGDA